MLLRISYMFLLILLIPFGAQSSVENESRLFLTKKEKPNKEYEINVGDHVKIIEASGRKTKGILKKIENEFIVVDSNKIYLSDIGIFAYKKEDRRWLNSRIFFVGVGICSAVVIASLIQVSIAGEYSLVIPGLLAIAVGFPLGTTSATLAWGRLPRDIEEKWDLTVR